MRTPVDLHDGFDRDRHSQAAGVGSFGRRHNRPDITPSAVTRGTPERATAPTKLGVAALTQRILYLVSLQQWLVILLHLSFEQVWTTLDEMVAKHHRNERRERDRGTSHMVTRPGELVLFALS